jgi:hypothetical protein
MAGGLTMRTCLEIYSNPYDLQFEIEQKAGKYILIVKRGPEHNFKLMIDSRPFEAQDLNGAVEVMKVHILDVVENTMKDQRMDPSMILNPELATRILDGLREGKVVNTHEWKPVASSV